MRKFRKEPEYFCPDCRLYKDICICSLIKRFKLSTRVSILMHSKEKRKVSNTGKIADLCLENSSIQFIGEKNKPLKTDELILEKYQNLVLYPDASNELSENILAKSDKPVNLIILDGNYNQTGRMFRSGKILQSVVKVRLPYGQIRKCKLRSDGYSEHISTIEAIINALDIINDISANEHMEYLFNEMTFRLLNRVKKSN